MSRGGRGGSRGGGRRNQGAPEIEDFTDDDLSPRQKKPQPLFPDINLPVPRPPSARELSAVKYHLRFRKRTRNGPYFATLDPSSVADERTGKTLKRAGFDPFNDQETYSSKNHKKKRDVPDLKGAGREYALKFFPRELWPLLDPKGKNPLSHAPTPEADPSTSKHKSLKRKRDPAVPTLSDDDTPMKDADAAEDEEEAAHTDSSDALIPSGRRARTISKAAKKKRRGRDRTNGSREKRGLDAEDDFDTGKKKGPTPPSTIRANEKKRKKAEARAAGKKVDDTEDEDEDEDNDVPNDDDVGDEDDGDDDDEDPVDTDFEESDEGDQDDYNAEGYFDDGDRDDEDGLGFGGGGGDEGGEC
ncbi:DNA-directed RNA polymerase III subunit C31 [Cladophialophora chaetospira]|uniref:DNA-directed RNA polymerase III subunit C31 n=1 Tax=Cladophialophora chaetospira TaxID=386627 RepID=A0AA39CL95_9EURO|nr:DNA-directed RNA polymerase III subunit C31 [Cladophialophora chaetospira]